MSTLFKRRIKGRFSNKKPRELDYLPDEDNVRAFIALGDSLGELEKNIYVTRLSQGIVKVRSSLGG